MAKKKKQSVAAKMWEAFIDEGKYPHLQQCKTKTKLLTSAMKERLSDSEFKRHEFTRYGLVGKFVAKKIYDIDYIALNEYLYDLGLLLFVVEIDEKKLLKENILIYDLIQEFRLPDTFYIRPSFNKAGRSLNEVRNFEVTEQWSIDDMARTLAILKPQVKELSWQYELLKRKTIRLPEIRELERLPKEQREPIRHKYGSLSLVAKPPKYDISKIYEYYGEGILIEYGKPDMKKVEKFILSGTITQSEIDQFKKVKDIRLDFSVMTLEDEVKILQMLDEKTIIAGLNRMRA